MTFSDAELIRREIANLSPTGHNGFEGLIAALLSALTGRRFFLASAGYQTGRDMSTGGLGDTWLAMEAKRYSQSTPLDERELLGELYQLSSTQPHPDLWILVTSRSVTDQIASSLVNAGRTRGVAVEFLQFPTDRPGDLDILCASEPQVLSRWLSPDAVQSAGRVQHLEGFDRSLQGVRRRFTAPQLGLDHFREAAKAWFCGALRSSSEARDRLGGPITLASDEVHFVPRLAAKARFDSWWQCWPDEPQPFVLLGEEGVGKSWAAAEWMEQVTKGSPAVVPLFLSSRDVVSDQPGVLLVSLLEKISQIEGAAFWKKRLSSWTSRDRSSGPVILLVLDGINERPDFEWRLLFDRLSASQYRDFLALLVTCRPGYWSRDRLVSEAQPVEFELASFSESELDEALSAAGRSRQDFVPDLLPVLRKPRYLSLVLTHYQSLVESGDFTIDRVLYEDWRDRLNRKDGLKLDSVEFRGALVDLARRYREQKTHFSRGELENLLPARTSADLYEILTGGFFKIEEAAGREYHIETSWLTHSLGLFLANKVRSLGRAMADELLASFLEPTVDLDQQAGILAAACLNCFMMSGCEHPARTALLNAWVRRQNHDVDSAAGLQAYVPLSPEVYLDVLEKLATESHPDHRAIERLEVALAGWRDVEAVRDQLASRSIDWLSWVNPLGLPVQRPHEQSGLISAPPKEDQGALRQLALEVRSRAGAQLHPGSSLVLDGEFTVLISDVDNVGKVAWSAVFFLSLLPVRYLIKGVSGWAVSRAIMGFPIERNEIHWLLRSRVDQESEGHLFEAAERMLSSNNRAIRRAGAEILIGIGSLRAMAMLAEVPDDDRGIYRRPSIEIGDDPCYARSWQEMQLDECLQRGDLSDEFVAAKLGSTARDPDVELGMPAIARVRRALTALESSDVWSTRGRTRAQTDLESIEAAAARGIPRQLVATYREIVRTHALDDDRWFALADKLSTVQLLLRGRRERAVLLQRWEKLIDLSAPKDQTRYREFDYFGAIVIDLPVEKQLELLCRRPEWTVFPTTLHPYLNQVAEPLSLEKISASIFDVSGEDYKSYLLYMLSQSRFTVDRAFVQALLEKCKDEEDSTLSEECETLVRLAMLRHGDASVLHWAIEDSNLSRLDLERHFNVHPEESGILRLRSDLPFELLHAVVGLGAASQILESSDRSFSDLKDFARQLHEELEDELARSLSDPYHPRFKFFFSVVMLRTLVRKEPLLANSWVRMLLEREVDYTLRYFVKSTYCFWKPFCESLLAEGHENARSVFDVIYSLTRTDRNFVMEPEIGGDFVHICCRADTRVAQNIRLQWFEQCWKDVSLLSFAVCCRRNGLRDYVFDLAGSGIRSSTSLEQARAISLSGWSGDERLVRILEGLGYPQDSWLGSLVSQALERHQRERRARHWFRRFLRSRGVVEPFCAFRLFLGCVDHRFYLWKKAELDLLDGGESTRRERVRFLKINQKEIEARIEENEKNLAKYFLGRSLPTVDMWPWKNVVTRGANEPPTSSDA